MALMFRAAAMAGALAGTTLMAAPTAAAPIAPSPAFGAPAAAFDFSRYDPASASAGWGCRWGCGWGRGWGGGWRGHRGWRRNRVDAGDVLIGAAIIGGVAAIVSSNNRRQRDRDVVVVERDRYIRDRDFDRRDNSRAAPRGTGSAGLDSAVNQCLDRIERDVRVDTVDNVDRTASGWQVSGVLFNGAPFQCRIGNSGQIDTIDYGGGFSGVGFSGGASAPADGQWSAQRYADARAAIGAGVRPDMAAGEAPMRSVQAPAQGVVTDRMPAYPGGPIPGEDIPETIEGDL